MISSNCRDVLTAHEYIQYLKQHYIKQREIPFINHIVLYLHKSKVYKVIIRYYAENESRIKRLFKKLHKSYDSHMNILNDVPESTITDQIVKDAHYDYLILVYNPHDQLITVHEGNEFDYIIYLSSKIKVIQEGNIRRLDFAHSTTDSTN